MTSQRLDEALAARGLASSRSQARDLILRGEVLVAGLPARKPAQPVAEGVAIALAPGAGRHVSRAALKLIHGLDHFNIPVAGLHCLDLGSSTGGFTQVLLERGAAHVTAVDVGHGQMNEALATDPRVSLLEGVNARELTRAQVPENVSLIVCDVSFISLKLALPPALALVKSGATLVALIKPQFEVGRENLGKGGVVRDENLHQVVCDDIRAFVTAQGWTIGGIVPSPLPGGDGNQEFILVATKT